jgi:hypothetical protein
MNEGKFSHKIGSCICPICKTKIVIAYFPHTGEVLVVDACSHYTRTTPNNDGAEVEFTSIITLTIKLE